MADSVRDMLDRLDREISQKIEQLRRDLAPLERELADVRKAKAALIRDPVVAGEDAGVVPAGKYFVSPYRALTMKQLTLTALREHFRNGATANQLLEFFDRAWGRKDIVRESFSPQLSRLKREGKIGLRGKTWYLIQAQTDLSGSVGPGETGNQGDAGASLSSAGDHRGSLPPN